jgi:hypothetical protein
MKEHNGRLRRRWEDNIKMYFNGRECEDVEWIDRYGTGINEHSYGFSDPVTGKEVT